MTRDDISLAVTCDRNISKVGKLTTFRLQEEVQVLIISPQIQVSINERPSHLLHVQGRGRYK